MRQSKLVMLTSALVLMGTSCTDDFAMDEGAEEPESSTDDGKADGASNVDLGGTFLAIQGSQDGDDVPSHGLGVFPRTHFFPGSRPHGSYLVIGMLTTLRTTTPKSKAAFEAYWGVQLAANATHRPARLGLDYVGVTKLALGTMRDGETSTWLDVSQAKLGECWARTGPQDPGLQRPAYPGSATPGSGATPAPGVTTPFISEVCNPSSGESNNGFGFVEIYIP